MLLNRSKTRAVVGSVLMEVPMQNPLKSTRLHDSSVRTAETDESRDTDVDPWTWWNTFRLQTDFNSKIMVALELSEDLPPTEVIQRWLCEPVSCIIVPANVFIRNAQNFPVLSKAHQSVITAFVKNDISFMVKCNRNDNGLRNYADYLRHLATNNSPTKDPMHGFDDILEIPLQPLYDNLDSYTYEVFEKDPVKYALYQQAIELALCDKVAEADIASKTVCEALHRDGIRKLPLFRF